MIRCVLSPSVVFGDGSDVVRAALTGAVGGTFDEAELRAGIGIWLPADGAAVYVIDLA
jgi:hypothetical protein